MPRKLRNIMKYRKITIMCLLLSIAINAANIFTNIIFLTIVGVLLLIAFIVISLLLWRCPYCGRQLPLRFNIDRDLIDKAPDDSFVCPYCKKNM